MEKAFLILGMIAVSLMIIVLILLLVLILLPMAFDNFGSIHKSKPFRNSSDERCPKHNDRELEEEERRNWKPSRDKFFVPSSWAESSSDDTK